MRFYYFHLHKDMQINVAKCFQIKVLLTMEKIDSWLAGFICFQTMTMSSSLKWIHHFLKLFYSSCLFRKPHIHGGQQ